MPDLYNIDETWSTKPWYSTGGTRAKVLLESPSSEFFYFKRSIYKKAIYGKPEKYFKYEFWSEIIAYEIGKLLNLNVLKYDIGIFDGNVGCISKSMINPDKEEFIEGVKYLQSYDADFNPEIKADRKKYTYQFIIAALRHLNLHDYINNINEMVVFDAIIGNSDRHQENWAIVNEFSPEVPRIKKMEENMDKNSKITKRLSWSYPFLSKMLGLEKRIVDNYKKNIVYFNKAKYFSPLYDNGCSLGRELQDYQIKELLENDRLLNKYVFNGFSEIHYNGQKMDHFTLIKYLIVQNEYGGDIVNILKEMISKYNSKLVEEIVFSIDALLPADFKDYLIPDNRKTLIVKLLNLRVKILSDLI